MVFESLLELCCLLLKRPNLRGSVESSLLNLGMGNVSYVN